MSEDARYSTLELTSGTRLTIDMTPKELRNELVGAAPMVTLPVAFIKGEGRSDTYYRKSVMVNPLSVAAIYALDAVPLRFEE